MIRRQIKLSRRTIVSSLASAPFVSNLITGSDIDSSKESLLSLGKDFDHIASQVDGCIERGHDLPDELLERLERVENTIESTAATSLQGLQVKARVACWGLLGDFDATTNTDSPERMARSIFRDLIRMHRPELEKPGALKKLLEKIECDAS